MVGFRAAQALLACALLAAPLAAQLSGFGETIDVRVVNVDAVVTGPDGRPVRGLGVEDFELRVDREPVPIAYFAAIEDGRVLRAEPAAGARQGGEAGPAPAERTAKPYLAVVWDQRAFRPKEAARTLDALVARLPALIDSTSGILIARQANTLGIEQSFTPDAGLLTEAIRRLDDRQTVSFARGERSLLLSRLSRAPDPDDARTLEQARLIEDEAERILREIHLQAQQERQEALAGLSQLRQLVSLLANLPGRKNVLYFGGGIQTRPAEAIYRVWWEKYRSIANRLRVPSFESQSDLTDVISGFVLLTHDANRQRVAFYAYDLSGAQPSSASVELTSVEATESSARESIDQQRNLLGLATSTGGLGTLHLASVEPLLDSLLGDLSSYYSLGFEASDAIPDRGRIEIRVRHPELAIRHFDRFERTEPEDDLERAAMTASITSQADNPLEVSVEVGESEKQKNGTFLVPLLVKVPISRLALLPRDDRHVGRLSIVVLARSAKGDLSPPAHGEVPIEIDNRDLLAAINRLAGYRLRMEVSPGEQTITIGLRDDVARTLSTLNLALDTS